MPSALSKAAADNAVVANPPPDQGEELSLQRLLEVSTIVLKQAVDLVDNSLTSDDQLTIHSQYMPGSTIGAASTKRFKWH